MHPCIHPRKICLDRSLKQVSAPEHDHSNQLSTYQSENNFDGVKGGLWLTGGSSLLGDVSDVLPGHGQPPRRLRRTRPHHNHRMPVLTRRRVESLSNCLKQNVHKNKTEVNDPKNMVGTSYLNQNASDSCG